MDFVFTSELWYLLPLFFLISFLYASVGHGGASGYLALMALFGFSVMVMKPTALLLNLVVAGISFIHYWKEGYFNWRLFFSFSIPSIPFAFIGGMIDVEPFIYKKILAVLLLFAILKMINIIPTKNNKIQKVNTFIALIIGIVIGLISGMIGIGGGVILTPIIVLFSWGKMKEAAAVSALFIWVNSAAGISGQFMNGIEIDSRFMWFLVVSLFGGFIGGFYGSKKFNNKVLRYLLASVLIIACIKLWMI